jgi:hypothetical protein
MSHRPLKFWDRNKTLIKISPGDSGKIIINEKKESFYTHKIELQKIDKWMGK